MLLLLAAPAVGGDMFKDAVACLADNGRVIIIGMMAQYAVSKSHASSQIAKVAH